MSEPVRQAQDKPKPTYSRRDRGSAKGRRKHDAYYTDRAITAGLLRNVSLGRDVRVVEPCAGEGDIAHMLSMDERVIEVITGDIVGNWKHQQDATREDAPYYRAGYEWLITNPPYKYAEEIVRAWWNSDIRSAAFLLRLSFLEPTSSRGEWSDELKRGIGRKGLLEKIGPHMKNMMVVGSPRPSFTGNGHTDSVTVAWMVYDKEYESDYYKAIAGWI